MANIRPVLMETVVSHFQTGTLSLRVVFMNVPLLHAEWSTVLTDYCICHSQDPYRKGDCPEILCCGCERRVMALAYRL